MDSITACAVVHQPAAYWRLTANGILLSFHVNHVHVGAVSQQEHSITGQIASTNQE